MTDQEIMDQSLAEADAGDPLADLETTLDTAVKSGIGRTVAAGVAALLPVLGIVCTWLQDVLGIDLKPAALSAFLVTTVGGAALLAWQWLRNRGAWEKEALTLYHKLFTAGQEIPFGGIVPPLVPPGPAPDPGPPVPSDDPVQPPGTLP